MTTTQTTINGWTEQHKGILRLIVFIICCCVPHLNYNWWCCILRVAPLSVFVLLFGSDIWLKSWHSVRLHSWHGCDYCHQGNEICWDFHGECYSWWMSLKLAFIRSVCVVKSSLGAWIKIMVFPLEIHQYLREQFYHEARSVNYICSVIWYCSSRAMRNNFYFFFALNIRKPVSVQRRVEFEQDECQTSTSFCNPHWSHLYPITHANVFWNDSRLSLGFVWKVIWSFSGGRVKCFVGGAAMQEKMSDNAVVVCVCVCVRYSVERVLSQSAVTSETCVCVVGTVNRAHVAEPCSAMIVSFRLYK